MYAIAVVSLGLMLVGISQASPSDITSNGAPPGPLWITAAQDVLNRLIPAHASNFILKASPPQQHPQKQYLLDGLHDDTFTVSASNGTVTVTGSSGVALTSGAYWYLKEVTKCQVTWGNNGTGDQLNLPATLPDVSSTTISSSVPIRYAWNMCTFSYSAAFWDARRWTREIDWMALHGVNFPLALTGQEYVWLKVFEDFNVSLSDLEPWFTGPAFLAWQRAGNIRGFAGPLSRYWIDGQMELQQHILKQMRALGMTPILTCFSGHVPGIARKIWPTANFTPSSGWNNFPPNETDVWYLDPTDPVFTTLGGLFMKKQAEIFGGNHYYNCDTFNEVDPKSTDPTYLKAASAAVHNAIAAGDPSGIWVMQAWLFHSNFWNPARVEAYLSGVSNNSMLILDLNSEAGVLAPIYKQYYGKSWVWNMLHNYGGVRGMYGNLTSIANGPYISLADEGSTMTGIGFTPEAIEQNPVMYEMLTSTFWSQSPIEVQSWLHRYVVQRYGVDSAMMWTAWQQLFDAVYNQPGEPRSEIEWVPHLLLNDFGWQNGNATGMLQAFKTFLRAAESMPLSGPLQYDLVDVARQASTMFFSDVHRSLANEGWRTLNSPPVNISSNVVTIGALMEDIITTIDDLLGTNPNYLLGNWVGDATSWASNPSEAAVNMYNAKNQITMWGPQSQIADYAAKAWQGLYGDYYLGRWRILIDMLYKDSINGDIWNSYLCEQQTIRFEVTWCGSNKTYPNVPPTKQSALAVAKQLLSLIDGGNATADYTVLPGSDVGGYDYFVTPTWTQDISQLAQLCNIMDDCAGFNSHGYLKNGEDNIVPSFGSTLYLKKTFTATTKEKEVSNKHRPSIRNGQGEGRSKSGEHAQRSHRFGDSHTFHRQQK